MESVDMETWECENTNTRPIRSNVRKGVEQLEMKFGGKTYNTQLTTSTGIFFKMHDKHKLAVDVKFTQMMANKGIKKHGEREVAAMNKK